MCAGPEEGRVQTNMKMRLRALQELTERGRGSTTIGGERATEEKKFHIGPCFTILEKILAEAVGEEWEEEGRRLGHESEKTPTMNRGSIIV